MHVSRDYQVSITYRGARLTYSSCLRDDLYDVHGIDVVRSFEAAVDNRLTNMKTAFDDCYATLSVMKRHSGYDPDFWPIIVVWKFSPDPFEGKLDAKTRERALEMLTT